MIDLRLGDCLDVMRTMPDASVDAVVTDPPYGIGFNYNGVKEATSKPADYWEWLRPKYEEALRCLKPGGLVTVWQSSKYLRHFWDWFGDEIRIYAACKNFVQLTKRPINDGFDPVVMFYKAGGPPLKPEKQRRSVNFFVANTAAVISRMGNIEKGHPCPRPLDQVSEILANFSMPGGVVLDPFMGSGTTGVAAAQLGLSFIGIESHEPYYRIAENRLETAHAVA